MCAEIWITTEVKFLLRDQGEEGIFQGESRIRRLNMGWGEKEKLEIWGRQLKGPFEKSHRSLLL